MSSDGLTILLIEDDPNDTLIVQQAVELDGLNHIVHDVPGGEEAIRYLLGQGEYADRRHFPLPNVILTDLKMPGMSGFSFLSWLRSQPQLSVIPAIAFSSSPAEMDVEEAYRVGANCYIVKPSSLERLLQMLRVICNFWSLCEHPTVQTA